MSSTTEQIEDQCDIGEQGISWNDPPKYTLLLCELMAKIGF